MLSNFKKVVFVFLFFIPSIIFSLELPEQSIYNIDITMIDRFGNTVKFKELAGKIHVFSMIYTNCKTICPIIISNMKALEKAIPNKYLQHINFLLISLDPDRDTPFSLNNFFLEKKLDERYWTVYKVNKEDVLKIALASGIKYKKDKDNEYIHSNLIVIIDKNGIIKLHHQGLDKNFNDIVSLIISLS